MWPKSLPTLPELRKKAKTLQIPRHEQETWAEQRFHSEIEKERRKLRKMKEELGGYEYQINAIKRNIEDYDERIRLWDIMEDFHNARMMRIESEEDLYDF